MSVSVALLASLVSLQQGAIDSVERRLHGADPSNALCRFINYPSGARSDRYVVNTNFWAKGIDFSCVSPWNSAGGALRAGTLISKRHVIFAKHFQMKAGTRIVFVGEDGGVCPCYIEKTKSMDWQDVTIGLLNAEVTPNIHPAKILPPNFMKYIGDGRGLPIGTFNQKEKLFLTEANLLSTNGTAITHITCRAPSDERMARFREKMITGDSGNPAFLLVADQAILLYCLRGGGTGDGPAVHIFRQEIQKLMDELCPGYPIEEFDFGGIQSTTIQGNP